MSEYKKVARLKRRDGMRMVAVEFNSALQLASMAMWCLARAESRMHMSVWGRGDEFDNQIGESVHDALRDLGRAYRGINGIHKAIGLAASDNPGAALAASARIKRALKCDGKHVADQPKAKP